MKYFLFVLFILMFDTSCVKKLKPSSAITIMQRISKFPLGNDETLNYFNDTSDVILFNNMICFTNTNISYFETDTSSYYKKYNSYFAFLIDNDSCFYFDKNLIIKEKRSLDTFLKYQGMGSILDAGKTASLKFMGISSEIKNQIFYENYYNIDSVLVNNSIIIDSCKQFFNKNYNNIKVKTDNDLDKKYNIKFIGVKLYYSKIIDSKKNKKNSFEFQRFLSSKKELEDTDYIKIIKNIYQQISKK